MNTFSHITMGELVCDYLKTKENISLKKLAFIYGNIKPDLSAKLFTHPHYKKSLNDFVRLELIYLSNTYLENAENIDSIYSERIGIICHYISDFFCLAHNNCYNDTIWTHIKYEKRLSNYMRKHKQTLKKLDYREEQKHFCSIDELCQEIELQHCKYINSTHCSGMDILYSIELCIQIVSTVVSFSAKYYKKYEEVNSAQELCFSDSEKTIIRI